MAETTPSPILQAVYRGDRETLDALLAADPELDVFEAAAVGDTERVAALLAANADLVTPPTPADGFPALTLAAFFGPLDAARLLLDRGADPDVMAAGPSRLRPLHGAVAGRHA